MAPCSVGGLGREGLQANLAICNERTIADPNSSERPLEAAVGVSHVLVGGELVLENG